MIRLALKIVGGIFAVVVLYLTFTFVQVWWSSRQDDRTPSNAIVVLGAAQWNGTPSPVYKERLDHAAELYKQGVAKTIVVTGGKQQGDKVGEGFAGYNYLKGKGVPEKALLIEVGGTNTYEELSAAVPILDSNNLGHSVTLVSSPYHAFRSEAIAREVGLSPHFSAADSESSLSSLVREAGGAAIGRIISFRRLSNLQ
jgi:uncharacterized SAM-binding protein YcdF (DUF218 family)